MTTNDPPGYRSLDAQLAALPGELSPPRDLWAGVDAALAGAVTRPRRWPYALAAGIVVASLGVLVGSRIGSEAVPPDRDGPVMAPAPTLAAARPKLSQEAGYQATRVALEQTYRERLVLLAPATRARIEQDLALIRAAQQDIRRELGREPGSRVLAELLQSTTEQEFDLYSAVGRNTEPFTSRART